MLSDPLTNFKIQKYYQNELRFNGAHIRNNSPKINYRTYVINLDAQNSKGTYWKSLYVNGDSATYFNNFEVEHIPTEVMGNKNIATNINNIQAYNLIMCGYFCIGFINKF